MTFANLLCTVFGHRKEVEFILDPSSAGGYLARRLCGRCGWHESEVATVHLTPEGYEEVERVTKLSGRSPRWIRLNSRGY